MKNNTEKIGELEIQWISVPQIPGGDCGVEFHYKTALCGKQTRNGREDGKVIGFIDGLGWLDKDGNPVKVYFLSSGSKEWGKHLPRAGKIISNLKECVFMVLEEKIKPDQIWHGKIIKANIFSCWNCY